MFSWLKEVFDPEFDWVAEQEKERKTEMRLAAERQQAEMRRLLQQTAQERMTLLEVASRYAYKVTPPQASVITWFQGKVMNLQREVVDDR